MVSFLVCKSTNHNKYIINHQKVWYPSKQKLYEKVSYFIRESGLFISQLGFVSALLLITSICEFFTVKIPTQNLKPCRIFGISISSDLLKKSWDKNFIFCTRIFASILILWLVESGR